jgi:diguanylate cyclase (GGDEF)-like protein
VVLITQALVHAIVTVQRYVVAMEAAHAQAWTLALTDPLTGLANRRRFDQHLETTIAQCHRDGTALALLLLDIDRFKEINDRWGHAAGDTALVQVAQALRASVGPGGLAARIGGDEFAVVLPARDESQARRVAQGVQGRLAVTSASGSRGEPIQVSIGAASLEPRPAARAEGPDTAALTILMAADRALYQMKASACRPA